MDHGPQAYKGTVGLSPIYRKLVQRGAVNGLRFQEEEGDV